MSNVNPNNINGAYPVAGVDNDSQGFRDNFTNIKNNFTYTAAELSDLQSKAIVKSALTGTTLNNNMAGTLLSSAQIQDFRETEYDNGIISTNVTLDHTRGHYQKVQTNGSITLAFANFPAAGTVGRIRLKLNVTNSAHTVILPASVTIATGATYIQEYNQLTNTLSFNGSGVGIYWFEFISDDAGNTVYIQDLSRQRNNTDYVYANVSNGTIASPTYVNVSTQRTFIDNAGTAIANINVLFPQNPVDGSGVQIASQPSIANLFLIANSAAGTIINGNITSLSANSHSEWTYLAGPNKWFRSSL
jgi:hypothetical protein